ncbi:MAG: glutamate-1-semialdehyde 2,1-aminomutase [Cyclobacteriaceae bacterium]|nr:glutamate-1-semialdehyde 2,1-aminomutase [Cyclobacteriaceae bacterium]
MQTNNSKELFEKARQVIPGGVNSPVRAFKAVGGNPVFFTSAKGAYMYDEDGNRYIDLINSWGPMILGHAFEPVEKAVVDAVKASPSFGAPGRREVEMAELIVSMVPSIEKVRMVNSGTEATMSAIRVARGYTGRDKFIKMEGCYHGHGDSFLIAAGSGAVTMGSPDSPGVTVGTAKDTLLAPYNDLAFIDRLLAENPNEIAAIIVEPVVGNMGCVLPAEGYLQGLRDRCDRHGIVLIFDEVMTGFRLAAGGAQELFGVMPDMTTLGKIIGGGLPVGAYGGKKEIMDFVSPQGPVYQAGTLSGNPVAMAAGLAMLGELKNRPEIYRQLDETTQKITTGIRQNLDKLALPYTINQVGSMYSLFFTGKKVVDFETAKTSDTSRFGAYFNAMLHLGIYLAPSQYESLFVSAAIGDEEVNRIVDASAQAMAAIHA